MENHLDKAPRPSPDDKSQLSWPPGGVLSQLRLWWLPRPVNVNAPEHFEQFERNSLATLRRAGGELPARNLREALLPFYGRINVPSYYVAMSRLIDQGAVTLFERDDRYWYRIRGGGGDGDRASSRQPAGSGVA